MENNDKLAIQVTEIDSRSKSNTHQIQEIKNEIKDIRADSKEMHELALCIKEIVVELKNMKDNQLEMNKRLGKLEEQPLNTYKRIKDIIITVILTALITGVITYIVK